MSKTVSFEIAGDVNLYEPAGTCKTCGTNVINHAKVKLMLDGTILCANCEPLKRVFSIEVPHNGVKQTVQQAVLYQTKYRIPANRKRRSGNDVDRAQLFSRLLTKRGKEEVMNDVMLEEGVVSSKVDVLLTNHQQMHESVVALQNHLRAIKQELGSASYVETQRTADLVKEVRTQYFNATMEKRKQQFPFKRYHKGILSAKDIARSLGVSEEHIKLAMGLLRADVMWPTSWQQAAPFIQWSWALKEQMRTKVAFELIRPRKEEVELVWKSWFRKRLAENALEGGEVKMARKIE